MVVQVDDRRVFDRFMARFPVKFKESSNDFGQNVFLRDIGAQGAKIVTKEELHPRDRIDLLVELPDGHDPLEVEGKAVWVQNGNPSSWDVGIKFDEVQFMKTQRIYKFCSS